MGFPGLETDFRGQAFISADVMDATLDHVASAGTKLVVILPQPKELPPKAISLLRRSLDARALRSIVMPIVDYSVPGPAFLRAWHRGVAGLCGGLRLWRFRRHVLPTWCGP